MLGGLWISLGRYQLNKSPTSSLLSDSFRLSAVRDGLRRKETADATKDSVWRNFNACMLGSCCYGTSYAILESGEWDSTSESSTFVTDVNFREDLVAKVYWGIQRPVFVVIDRRELSPPVCRESRSSLAWELEP
ncbi:hypothetical protein R1flu_007902 [Riccia fluitans]|uniref:Uncharacterized protein n=1 Tax=Riccia fluitans TaxID=41844 RepID=A0ABD1Z069_9MARC